MTTAVPGLIKIGKTGSNNFEQRMYNLEHDGYRNVTALKRAFAIEVDDYDEKEFLLHTIFEKSRLADTELFAIDVNIVKQLLSSFDGKLVYPKEETKESVFVEATDNAGAMLIPDGVYTFKRKKKAENKLITAKAVINNGHWMLMKGSIIALHEDNGCSQKAKLLRTSMPLDSNGKLLEDFELGVCSPSFAGNVVIYQACNGWMEWKDKNGDPVDKYRLKEDAE